MTNQFIIKPDLLIISELTRNNYLLTLGILSNVHSDDKANFTLSYNRIEYNWNIF